MKYKQVLFAVLSMLMLVAFYAVSLQTYLSYQNTVKTEAQRVQELLSTDLSGLSFNGYKVGEEISIVPYEGWNDDYTPDIVLNFDDGTRERIRDIYYIGGIINSRLNKIEVYDLEKGVSATQNNEVINELTHLQDYFGNCFIEIPASSGMSRLIIYIDHENNLKLTLEIKKSSIENSSVFFEEFNSDLCNINIPESNTDVWVMGGNPFSVTTQMLMKLDYNYTIFRHRNYGFTNYELFILPIYYFILFLPMLALIVFRSKKLLYLNSALTAIYILWSVATIMYHAQF